MRENMEKGPEESGVSEMDELSNATMRECCGAKHRRPPEEEMSMVNGIRPAACPWCGGHVVRELSVQRSVEPATWLNLFWFISKADGKSPKEKAEETLRQPF
jgi:hypothetical protein